MPTATKVVIFLNSLGDAESYQINLLCVGMPKEANERSFIVAVAVLFMLQSLSIYIKENISYYE